MQAYINLMRLNRPIGIFLLLWPTLIALWLASDGAPDFKTLLIFIVGTILMRSAGCVINDVADRKFDAHVTRTKDRPLAAGLLTSQQAMWLFAALLGIAFALVLMLHKLTMYLSFVAVVLAISYPFAKRITNYPQLILGIAFAWGIPMAYLEVCGHLSIDTWLLLLATVSWVVAYDTEYAMVDKQDDLKIGIKSTAIAFGVYDRVVIFILQLFSLILFTIIAQMKNFSLFFYMCLAFGLGLVLYQQWLIKDRKQTLCFKAFLLNNYFGLAIFLGIALHKIIY